MMHGPINIRFRGRIFRSEIQKRIKSIWKKEELPKWKESITVPINKKCIKTDGSNNRGIQIFSTFNKIIPNILLSRLSPYAEDITGNHQCGFRCHRPTTDHMYDALCIMYYAFVKY